MNEIQNTFLTQQGLKKLQDEHEDLKKNRIPSIAIRIDEAKQQGDLSENAEYHSAREEMAWAQTRLIELEQILQNVEVIKSGSIKRKEVYLGSTVTVAVNGQQKKFTIVGPQEADPSSGVISNESPLGKGFIGRKIEEKIDIKTPKGIVKYTIIDIE